jgi:HD-like signal output (HDOD) protein
MELTTHYQRFTLDELFQKAGDIKVIPAVARKVIEIIGQEDVAGKQLAGIISQDPALSAHLLKAANSSLYGLPRKIETILMAINVLGLRNVRDMSLMVATRGVYKRFGITEKMLWTHAVSCAVGAKAFAVRYAPWVAEDAFICGLLHDVGKVILNNECPELFSEVMMQTYNEGVSFIRAESSIFGYTHTEIGSLVTKKWNFPNLIPEVCLQHHRDEDVWPTEDDSLLLKVLACVDLANTFCKVVGAGYRDPNKNIVLSDRPAYVYLGIAPEETPVLTEELAEAFDRNVGIWAV